MKFDYAELSIPLGKQRASQCIIYLYRVLSLFLKTLCLACISSEDDALNLSGLEVKFKGREQSLYCVR